MPTTFNPVYISVIFMTLPPKIGTLKDWIIYYTTRPNNLLPKVPAESSRGKRKVLKATSNLFKIV